VFAAKGGTGANDRHDAGNRQRSPN
jgi:hypothetical protein